VREQLSRFTVPPHTICFEITETAAIANLDKAAHFIRELRALGCRFSLDDFGAGMSSFAYLKHLPVDFLKIDGGFVKDMADDPIDRAMVEAINSVGHVMGKQTIAEFVDSDRVMAALREIGVDYAQGYGVAKPRPFETRLQIATRVA
jgi:EAL domain-containing protein (putative c-di-GMP-specific phosphodiesterase class I)